MLVLNHPVPDALILPEPLADLRSHLGAQGAQWFAARPDCVETNGNGAVTALKSLTGDAVARQTKPNKGHARLTAEGLAFRAGVHCGFIVPEASETAACWSCALRFQATEDDARTLFTANPESADNYVFLQHSGGEIVFKDQKNAQEIRCPAPDRAAACTVIAGLSHGRLWLQVPGRGRARGTGDPLHLDGPLALFIGCRSNKPRLLKTLGAFHLHDLVFWPDRNVLDPAQEDLIDAFADAALWRPAP